MGKIIETKDISDWEILSDDGWHDITHIHKTVKYDVWELITDTHTLKGADEHIVINGDGIQVYMKDLMIGDTIKTDTGDESVLSIKKLDIEPEHMYDVTVDSADHTFYSSGILSHNTTMSSVFLLHYLLFNKDKTIAVLANKESAAKEVLRRIKGAYEMLPLWMQQGVNIWNEKSIGLENGMRLIASTTSSDSISGETISLLYLDEFAKVKPHVAEEFITATMPVIASGKTSKVIIVSTPLGMNHFYSYWKGATEPEVKNQNNFYPIKVNWWDHPNRNDAWKKEVLQTFNNDLNRFNQEFGNKFLGSSDTLIDSEILDRMVIRQPIDIKYNGLFKIYEAPLAGAVYVMGVDTAKGTGRDYSLIQVIKIDGTNDLTQVAVYRDANISPHDFAQACIGISKYYNEAMMMIESNGIGEALTNAIWYEYEYDNIANVDTKGLGVFSSTKTKLQANLLLKRYLDNGYLKLYDEQTIAELSRYVEVRPNIFKAESSTSHDDCVTSLLWAVYFMETSYYDSDNIEVKTLDQQYDLTNSGPIMFLP